MSWLTIRSGMETRLNTISGLKARRSMAATLPDKDVAVVLPGEPLLAPDGHRGMQSVNIRVVVRCKRGDIEDAQAALDAYIWPSGASSVIVAVEAEPTLGGAVPSGVYFTGVVSQYGASEGEAGAFQADVNFRAPLP